MNLPCTLCAEIADPSAGYFATLYGSVGSRILPCGKGLLVMPTVGQLTDLHLLVLPEDHQRSFAGTPPPIRRKAGVLVERLVSAIESAGYAAVVFEHGLGAPECVGCGVSHAHLHVVGVPASVHALEPPRTLCWRRLETTDFLPTVPTGADYVFLCNQAGQRWMAPVVDLPSQFMRRWLAGELGLHQWDWRVAGAEERIPQKLPRLVSLLEPVVSGA
jgi:diadenosine tetraphosphate (Ap4A) HIT family hydrolase